MSSSNDLFGPEDFDNLIAAVDSLEIPLDDASTASPDSEDDQANTASLDPASTAPAFEAGSNPFGANTTKLSLEEDEFAELDDLAADYSELDFEDEQSATQPFSASVSFASPSTDSTSTPQKPGKAQFNVDDPFSAGSAQTAQESVTESAIDDEDDLIDFYESFLEATNESENLQPQNDDDNVVLRDSASAEKLDLFGDDGYEVFDGVAAANEISNLFREGETTAEQNAGITTSTSTAASTSEPAAKTPLISSMEKTQQAANKLKAHLASISAKHQQPAETPSPAAIEPVKQSESADEELIDGFEDLQALANSHNENGETSNVVNFEVQTDVQTEVKTIEKPEEQTLSLESELLQNTSHEESFDEFDEFFDEPAKQVQQTTAMKQAVTEPEKQNQQALPVGDLAEGPIELSSKSSVISDDLMAAFLESTLSSKQKIRFFSLQSFASKFPRIYFACTLVLSLVGFLYILAIPALLGIAMFNGFEMMNSPFTDNMVLLLAGLFGISLFLFMAGYKLLDLKFMGPGGITLNHENASELIEKLQQLRKEQKTPKIHEVILTRRHELNVIKLPRFGLPVWSKNVLAIGYPLLQTLPAEYFDVALTRRLVQFNKRKNILHNWLSFMRRTWTIYAVSLKERKGLIDLLHYCFFAPYASLYRHFSVYVSQKDELLADEKALHYCNDRDLMKTAQTLRITRAMLVQYFWPKLNEELHSNTASPQYVKPYSQLPGVLKTLLDTRQVDAWFIRLGQEETNPGDPEAPFAKRMATLGQRKVALPESFDVNAAQRYFGEQYDEMTELLDNLWAEEVQKALFDDNIHSGNIEAELPCYLSIEPA